MTYSSPYGTISFDGTTEMGIASIGSIEELVKILIFLRAEDSADVDAFLFLASFSAAFVFFTSDAERSVGFFTLEDFAGGAEDEVGAVSSGTTDGVALAFLV